MKKFIHIILAFSVLISMVGCKDFLDQEPDNIYTADEVFSDASMIRSVLANLYGRVNYGMNLNDSYSFTYVDEAAKMDGGTDYFSTYSDTQFRVYDYTFVRNCNQFLESLSETTALSDDEKAPFEGEVRFLRAWCYFNMIRSLGGVPLMGDEVYGYTNPEDVLEYTKARSTEAESYDYVISECEAAYNLMGSDMTTHSARANKWTARILEARAAIYAASLAKYNNLMDTPITTDGGEVGIPAELADSYYQTALTAAVDVINNSPYVIQDSDSDKGMNFYNAVCIKDNNTEVMWCHDYYYPGSTVSFSNANIPSQYKDDIDNSYAGPVLNLVEQYEPLDTDTPGQGEAFKTVNEDGSYVFYNSCSEPFDSRDPRLYGTVLYPGGEFRGTPCELQAGQLILNSDGEWVTKTTDVLGETDDDGNIITSQNGPQESNKQYVNKTGFFFRKFLDESAGSSMRNGARSTMWWPYFRISEAYMIACEASFELGNTADALTYINVVRERAGVQDLTTITFDNIVHENQVEFAFEFHRFWDLKRWRLADQVFDGEDNDHARFRVLWPYLVVAPGNEHDGQWVFVENKYFLYPNPRYFRMQNYYCFIDDDWVNRNSLLVKNPYQ